MTRSLSRSAPKQGKGQRQEGTVSAAKPRPRLGVLLMVLTLFLSGCGSETPKAAEEVAKKPG